MMAAFDTQNMRGTLLLDEPMSRHTSWRIGGPADRFYTPADMDDLAEYIKAIGANEPVVFIGLGSNLLVRDKGFRGTVISLKGSLSEIENLDEQRVRAGAGASCAKLARYCHRNNLLGGEFFAGIPGLVGGALAMNAGAFGGETWSFVESVLTIDRQGELRTRTADDYEIGYRRAKGHDNEWFVSAEFKFKVGDGEKAAKQVRALLDKRNQSQPTGQPSCGSVFKNPEGDYAARLIESCGLKGFSLGQATVSEKHANFMINTGNAKASDMEALILHVQKVVEEETKIKLVTEVKIIGEAGDDSL